MRPESTKANSTASLLRELRVNALRLNSQIEALAAVDRREDGSCCRLAATDSDRKGRDLLVGWMRDLKLDVRIDAIGNIFGLRLGLQDCDPVMIGSHIDTVATGGRYDGAYGVLSGLEVIHTLQEADVTTQRPIVLAAFTNEEGVRFEPDMMGSLVFAGDLRLEEALQARAPEGVTLGAELKRIGYAGTSALGSPKPHAYIELHIEQGPILDHEGGMIGVVTDLQGISWTEFAVEGIANHAGTTPMELRHDAGYCAGKIAVFVRDMVTRLGKKQVGTVGHMTLLPNLTNVIAGHATVRVDLRNIDNDCLMAAETELQAFVNRLAQEEGVAITGRSLVRTQPVIFDREVVATIERVAADLELPVRRMTSGAGHDAQMLARICPTAMIFVPSVNGISHNPAEFTKPEHLEMGANVLLHTLLRLAGD